LPTGQTASSLALLVVTSDGVVRHPLPATGSVRIGRADGNDIKIDEASVSRQHAVLHLKPAPVLEDLGGSNGTALRRGTLENPEETQNLIRLQREQLSLQVGDRILLGTVQLLLVEPASETTPATATEARSPAMQALYAQAELAAKSPISVLIGGETGVGKDVLARFIHGASARSSGPFVALNCAALPENLLEAELFGSERGAFTGAAQARPGLFESAEGGTVFLDEVGELPLTTQSKLLRVVEERAVMRVGGRSMRQIDVRFLAATNRDLEAYSQAGKFREDLYYRLSGLVLVVPPLRERTGEIEALASGFLRQTCQSLGRPALTFSEQARERLLAHRWPGNVRELKNAVERAALLCTSPIVGVEHLPDRVRSPAPASAPAPAPISPVAAAPTRETEPVASDAETNGESLMERAQREQRDAERERIRQALETSAGNQRRAAELLGISRRTLVNRLNELDLPRPRK
jgi:two-component system, NtrC family, response regulator AtoC